MRKKGQLNVRRNQYFTSTLCGYLGLGLFIISINELDKLVPWQGQILILEVSEGMVGDNGARPKRMPGNLFFR